MQGGTWGVIGEFKVGIGSEGQRPGQHTGMIEDLSRGVVGGGGVKKAMAP